MDRRSNIHKYVRGFILTIPLALLTSCLPKEVSNPVVVVNSSAPQYSGFEGLISAQTVSATKIKLTWGASTDSNVVAYNIYDATMMFEPKLIKTVQAPTTEVTITGLTEQKYYVFRVRAADSKNKEDGNKKDLPAIPYAGVKEADVQSSTSAYIPFNDGSNADQINIYCKSANETEYKLMAEVKNVVNATKTLLNNLEAGMVYTCRAALVISGFVDNNTATTTFTPIGQASKIEFATQPGSSTAGTIFAQQPVVLIKDVNNNTVAAGPDASAVVTLTLSVNSPTNGTLRGTYQINAVKGVATFTDLNIREAGSKVLTVSKEDTSNIDKGSGVLTADSNAFNISAGAVSATQSSIAISPEVPPNSPLVANGNSSYSVVINLRDEFDNPILATKPKFGSNISGDTLNQPVQETDSTGTTTGSISTTIADTAPARTLSITSPAGLTSVNTLAPFVPGTATKLAFTQQPVNSPAGLLGINQLKVAIQDAQGNTVITGAGSTAVVSVSIASNVNNATLSGTTVAIAVNGVAIFSDLGIDKTQTGYKLIASSGNYTPAYSNNFNVSNGTPKKIGITGPTNFISGTCSSAVTIQLQDQGGNPAGAVQNTPVVVSGLGGASMYSSNACGGTALSSTLTFTSNTSTKTVYLKDPKGERLSLIAADTSGVLTVGTKQIDIYPNKMSFSAQAAAPAAPGTPLSVVAGQCSTAMVITPSGDNGLTAPTFVSTPIIMTGINGTSGKIYSDVGCTVELDPMNFSLPITYGQADYTTKIYFKDPKAETLSLSLSDPNGLLTTTSSLQTVKVTASNIDFTGPTSVVAGHCSTSYIVTLKDTQGNSVLASQDTPLTINGLSGSATGKFYTSPSCNGAGSSNSVTIPSGFANAAIYLSDTAAETLSIYISDPAGKMVSSSTINVSISPSALAITGPSPASAKTTVCAGPFTVSALDGLGTPTGAITPITANLTGSGLGGKFFGDSNCSTTITSLSFATGDSTKQFYFRGQYPAASLTFTATDAASVLSSGTMNFVVQAAKGWLGTAGTRLDSNGDLLWFTQNIVPVSGRTDGARSVRNLHFDATYNYLYVVDYSANRILKYDYVNHTYIGWLGRFTNLGGIGVTGSNLTTPSAAACVATVNNAVLPGWCVGGQPQSPDLYSSPLGHLYNPIDLTDDGTYIYVLNYNGFSVSRFNADTGAFDGYIGTVSGTPTAAATGGPATCTTTTPGVNSITPGWCRGGTNYSVNNLGQINLGNGGLYYPTSIAYDNGYIFVARRGAILRFEAATGTFAGWIGKGGVTTPTGGTAGCTSLANWATTPGWCTGGSYQLLNPISGGGGGVNVPSQIRIFGGILYVLHTDNGGTITKYNASSGAYLGYFSGAAGNWFGPSGLTTNGTDFFVADSIRLIKIDPTGVVQGWLGKVSNSSGLSDGAGGTGGCSTLVPNANTPSWCLGGSAKMGMDETSYHQLATVEYDGNGSFLVGQGTTYPGIKKFNATTGEYQGMLANVASSPTEWSNDPNQFSQYFGFDDGSMFGAAGSYNDGTYLYVAEHSASRIKKYNLATGALVGWLGGVTTSPTGGGAGCVGSNPMTASPGWCTGALPNPNYLSGNMITSSTDGIMYQPMDVTGDGTYIYVVDMGYHRIQKFKASDGTYMGWIGRINASPTGGAPGCSGAPSGTFTPGWCKGGTATNGSADGNLYNPTNITYAAGNLYVVDSSNYRISSYTASTGGFNGWIGRVSTAPSGGCTTAANGSGYSVSSSGWCTGGTASNSNGASNPEDRGGGFYFWSGGRNGITTDGNNLYISNFYNNRIDKFSLNGIYLGSIRTLQNNYIQVWSTNSNSGGANPIPASNAATLATWYVGSDFPAGIWTDGTYLYGANYNPIAFGYGSAVSVWKMDLATGNMVGWQGAIDPGNPTYSPDGGDSGCAGATIVTPGWCRNGRPTFGYKMGQFGGGSWNISGDSHFIYVTDDNSQRITRIPK